MKEIKRELKKLDKILALIGCKSKHCISKDELEKNPLSSHLRIDFLENEGLIMRSRTPVYYSLTQKGIVFIANGGYSLERKRSNRYKTSNMIYLIGTPIIALVSLLISFSAFHLSNTTTPADKNGSNPNLSSSFTSLWIDEDSMLNEVQIIEKSYSSCSDTLKYFENSTKHIVKKGGNE